MLKILHLVNSTYLLYIINCGLHSCCMYSKTDHFFVDRYILAVASPTSIHQVGLHWNETVTFPLKDEKTC